MAEPLTILESVRAGSYREFPVRLRTAAGNPVTTFTADVPLSASLYAGAGQAPTAAPAVAWILADDSGASLRFTFQAADTQGLDAGLYRLDATATVGGRPVLVFEGAVRVTIGAGSDPAPAVYITRADLADFAGWLDGEADPAEDLAGFLDHRAAARRQLDLLVHTRWSPATLGGTRAAEADYLFSGAAGAPRSPQLAAWLAEGRLVVDELAREHQARVVLGRICRDRLTAAKEDVWLPRAEWNEWRADQLARSMVVGIDTTTPADGVADIWVNLALRPVRRG